MIVVEDGSFRQALDRLTELMGSALAVDNRRWQGIDVAGNPAARMYELRDVALSVPLEGVGDLDHWRADVRPNLPWADDHFAERVGKEPLNPGVQWMNWPWASSADKFRREEDARFNHSYSERLWPRWARRTPGGRFDQDHPRPDDEGRQGIDRRYGDLDDLIDLLVRDPYTRQAWIPLFFPEDTGWGDGGRKMCSLGYQFMRRGDRIHLYYPLRSCDLVRHLRDDVYLAIRMLLWVLGECRRRGRAEDRWAEVRPGDYSMWMTSLHCFENDRRTL